MTQIDRVSVILPSYNPSDRMLTVIEEVLGEGFRDLILVNDGSHDGTLFHQAAGIEGCTVLWHTENRGKGAALKTGMAYFMENRPLGLGIVTIDDDGQHQPQDIRRCAEAMQDHPALILGVRDFSATKIPPKSRLGNRAIAALFRIGAGLDLSDTQTGLRAIPRIYIPPLLAARGDRFEYETNMLLAAKREGFPIKEIPIGTVYIDGNKATHFNAIKDSLTIVAQFGKYVCGALLSGGIDLLAFYVLLRMPAFIPDQQNHVLFCSLAARGFSSMINFFINKNVVFAYKGDDSGNRALRYLVLCLVSALLSAQCVAMVSRWIGNPATLTLAKITIDTALFGLNYSVQKRWVYKP